MKRNLVIVGLVTGLLMSACSKTEIPIIEESGTLLLETAQSEAEQEVLPPIIENESKAADWIEAYFELIKTEGSRAAHIRLIDIDFDGVPEMFFSAFGTSSSWVFQGYSFKDGIISEILIDDEFMPTNLELYQNKETSQYIWLADGMFRSGEVYEDIWYEIDFSDFSDVKKFHFFGWKETIKGEGPQAEVTYTLTGADGEDYPMDKREIDERKKELFSGYQQINIMNMFSFTNEFIIEDKVDRELFYSFASLYEDVNLETYEKDVIPIYNIGNGELSAEYWESDYQLSLIEKNYIRIDEAAGADINLNYVQVNHFSNSDIQTIINDLIKSEVFYEWDVETEENVTLEMFQHSSLYENFLSIYGGFSCYFKDATHPWGEGISMVFNLDTGEEVSLSDILIIDERLKEKMLAGCFKSNRLSHEFCLEWDFYDEVYNSISTLTNEGKSKGDFYLTKTSLHIVYGVSHSMGDYVVFEVNYQDIEELMHN